MALRDSSQKFGLVSFGAPEMFIEVGRQTYQQAKRASRLVSFAGRLEESFEVLLQAFMDHERTLHEMALRFAVTPSVARDEQATEGDRCTANRIFVSFLATARMYVDKMPAEMRLAFGTQSEHHERFINLRDSERRQSSAFRLMHEFRNYALHEALPVEVVTYGSEWEKPRNPEAVANVLMRNTVSYCSDVGTLLRSAGFLALADDIGKHERPQAKHRQKRPPRDGERLLDLPNLVRHYVTALARMHVSLRSELDTEIESADQVMQQLRSMAEGYVKANLQMAARPDALAGLAVICRDSANVRVPILLKPGRRWRYLKNKNHHIDTLDRRYAVTVRPQPS